MTDPLESPDAFARRVCQPLSYDHDAVVAEIAERDRRVRAEGIELGTNAMLVAFNTALDDGGDPGSCLSRLRALVVAHDRLRKAAP